MPLAYYSVSAREEFWTEHWGGHSVPELLEVARRSPLTDLIVDALPRRGTVLEAGCGLGQYVVLLRERGWCAVGVDWSADALRSCREFAAVPLAAMELRTLALRTGAVAAYVSLGVVEHDVDSPDAILGEAARVLGAGGVLLVSVPYVNGVRRLGRPWLVYRGRRLRKRGATFYQYAFTRREVRGMLERHGFTVRGLHPYDPARIVRHALGKARRHDAGSIVSSNGNRAPHATRPGGSGLRRLARGFLYTPPMLRMLGHMILAVGVKR